MGTQRLNDLVFVHYNMRLRIKHIREGEDKDHFDPIDLAYIYNEDEDEDPILEWLQENGQPVLDEEQGRPSSRIATEMGINVEEYISSSEHSRSGTPGLGGESDTDDTSQPPDDDEGGDSGNVTQPGTGDLRGESQRPLSPFTGEDEFTHATQDDHHGARQPSRPDPLPYHYKRKPREDTTQDSDSWSSQTRGSLLESFDSLNIHDPTDPYDYSSYGDHSYEQSDYTSESGWTRTSSSYIPSQQSEWDMSSIFNYAPPQTEYEQQSYQGLPSQDCFPQQPQQVLIAQYPLIGFLIQLPISDYHYYIMEYQTYYSHMSWNNYVFWKESQIRQQIHRAHNIAEQQHNIDEPRHSFWY